MDFLDVGELQRGLVAEEGAGQFLDGTETSLARQRPSADFGHGTHGPGPKFSSLNP